jgi:hypothetical protein
MQTRSVKYLLRLLLAAALVSCATPRATPTARSTGARDSASTEKAIVVPKTGEITGVAYEYEYIRSHYPGARPTSQALSIDDAGRAYDAITFTTPDRKEHILYSDIQRFFGKIP